MTIKVQNEIDCCGISELTPIRDYENDPKTIIQQACYQIYENDETGAFLMFSDIGKKRAAKNLERFIKKNKLGTTIKTKNAKNPNSGSSLQVWIWKINQRNLKSFWLKNKITREKIYD